MATTAKISLAEPCMANLDDKIYGEREGGREINVSAMSRK
jgi:hypothetical protein